MFQGAGWNIENLLVNYDIDNASQKSPRAVLDEYFPNNPAVFTDYTSHACWVNSKALEAVDFTNDTPDPVGGRIIRRSNKEAIGILYDNAGDIVLEKAWIVQKDKASLEYYGGLRAGLRDAAKYGITTIGDGRMYWRRGWMTTWNKMLTEQKLTVRVVVRPWVYPEVAISTQIDKFKTFYRGETNSRLMVNQVSNNLCTV